MSNKPKAPTDPRPAAATTPAGHALPVGTRLEYFEIGRVISASNFGIVYAATDLTLQHPVAIKEYLPTSVATRGEQLQVRRQAELDAQPQFAAGNVEALRRPPLEPPWALVGHALDDEAFAFAFALEGEPVILRPLRHGIPAGSGSATADQTFEGIQHAGSVDAMVMPRVYAHASPPRQCNILHPQGRCPQFRPHIPAVPASGQNAR